MPFSNYKNEMMLTEHREVMQHILVLPVKELKMQKKRA